MTAVAPLVGAWIEINNCHVQRVAYASLPSWERGLKCLQQVSAVSGLPVAPLVGAWIEIGCTNDVAISPTVAPLVGAWIEIS